MEAAELLSLVEHLEDNIDDLEEHLEPLLSAALSATTKKLPVLDKAKLYVLIVYSIESLLFSYLRLNGVQAKEHPVFKELTRVKQYFEKIKVAEAGPTKLRENLSLNKQAAGRVIKHALAGNDKYDLERAEREARERALANLKLRQSLNKKMSEAAPEPKLEKQEERPSTEYPTTNPPPDEAAPQSESSSSSSSSTSSSEDGEITDSEEKQWQPTENHNAHGLSVDVPAPAPFEPQTTTITTTTSTPQQQPHHHYQQQQQQQSQKPKKKRKKRGKGGNGGAGGVGGGGPPGEERQAMPTLPTLEPQTRKDRRRLSRAKHKSIMQERKKSAAAAAVTAAATQATQPAVQSNSYSYSHFQQ